MNLETDKFNGYYTTGFINNGFFEKHLRFHSGDEYLLYHKIFNCNSELIITYYNEIKESGVYVPNIIEILESEKEIILKQEYIQGKSLVEWIKENSILNSMQEHINYFNIILGYQFDVYNVNNKLRMDFNLNNFSCGYYSRNLYR